MLPKKIDVHIKRPYTGMVASLTKKSKCVVDDENFRKTGSKLMNINFNHHDPEMCVCAYCTCGRHLCKMHIIKPDLHNFTTYRGDYNNKKPLQNLRFRPSSSHKSNGKHMDLNSTYGKDFDKKSGDIERPKPDDCLGVGGPLAGLTTYSSGFPGYRGDNQYVISD
jgi:inhibitor of KinA sporulation pathway (predicted exonuclease)